MSAAVHTRERLTVTPAGGSAGAYVTGVDLARPTDTDAIAGIRKALHDHLVVALPYQKFSFDDMERSTHALWVKDVTPYFVHIQAHPVITRDLKTPHD